MSKSNGELNMLYIWFKDLLYASGREKKYYCYKVTRKCEGSNLFIFWVQKDLRRLNDGREQKFVCNSMWQHCAISSSQKPEEKLSGCLSLILGQRPAMIFPKIKVKNEGLEAKSSRKDGCFYFPYHMHVVVTGSEVKKRKSKLSYWSHFPSTGRPDFWLEAAGEARWVLSTQWAVGGILPAGDHWVLRKPHYSMRALLATPVSATCWVTKAGGIPAWSTLLLRSLFIQTQPMGLHPNCHPIWHRDPGWHLPLLLPQLAQGPKVPRGGAR